MPSRHRKHKTMKASDRLIEALKRFEELRTEAYLCAGGRWTIGYGHTLTAREGMIIDEQRAEHLLRQDVNVIERWLSSKNITEEQHQFDALVSFVFNLGIASFYDSTLRKVIERGGSAEEVRKQWMRWVHVKKKVLPGLVKRREWECNLFVKGEY